MKQINEIMPTPAAACGLASLHPVDPTNPVILSTIQCGVPTANHSAGKMPSPKPFDRSR